MVTTTMASTDNRKLALQTLPCEVQVQIASFLQALDLAAVQRTCTYFNDPELIHKIVIYTSQHVYVPELTTDLLKAPKGNKYTLEHLRSMELTLVARVLSLPEPKTGFYVSKSWIKKTLLWLETVNERPTKKKLNKKQQRQRARRLSDVSPPWPDVNSDILCSHQRLQRCGAKAARSRRRLMDKQAWKILKKLYPDSTQLESGHGECLQCLLESETARKTEQDRLEQEKLERKKPLSNPLVRQFYTRTRGVPAHCLLADQSSSLSTAPCDGCPLRSGKYVVIPRAWCHKWRRYMKTGEGNVPTPPDSCALLCHAHKNALLPPHLECFLMGQTSQLLATTRATALLETPNSPNAGSSGQSRPFNNIPVGLSPVVDTATMNAMIGAGMSEAEVAAQQMAMLQLQQRHVQRGAVDPHSMATDLSSSTSLNDMLDRENHVVVELITAEEWEALIESGCWPKQLSHFAIEVTVENKTFHVNTNVCRECDPTGSRFLASAEVKYRRKRWEPRSVEQKRIPQVEY